jgi:nucleoside-diphosphate-sugar epimerase
MIFLTGFPGFLGTRFVRSLADQHPESSFLLLIQPKFDDKARAVLKDLELTDRAEILHGDITKPDLGLGERHDEIAGKITRAFHLAAVYDLSIPREIGWKVNVDGTRHVVDLLEQAPNLDVFGYISTAYVSGKRTGTIREDELVHDAGFKNFYEETKYHAEVIVQGRMDAVPTIIFRPAVVVGDSETGETAKLDGPYFILKALQKLPPVTLMTRIGSGTREVNLVPVDYVIDAMTYLSNQEENIGETFHLTDPHPLTTQGVMETFTKLLGMKVAYVPIPPGVARALMSTGVGRVLGISPELIDYFDHPAHYDTSRVEQALRGSGIRCPRLPDYAPNMVKFMKQHAELRSDAMY